jgi:hypothetical protein
MVKIVIHVSQSNHIILLHMFTWSNDGLNLLWASPLTKDVISDAFWCLSEMCVCGGFHADVDFEIWREIQWIPLEQVWGSFWTRNDCWLLADAGTFARGTYTIGYQEPGVYTEAATLPKFKCQNVLILVRIEDELWLPINNIMLLWVCVPVCVQSAAQLGLQFI